MGIAAASDSDPAQWPSAPGRDPELTATPNTIRLAGADRYQTNLALALALRGAGDFPFDTSDRNADWWGAATCPRSILVVAGDTFADALAASSLSDPTDRSDQPRLARVAAADPDFDPPGGVDRVDTASAPVIVTESARAGATALGQAARAAAFDLAHGGCTNAREAVIVGGNNAVPVGVEKELVGLGYQEVFRAAGDDRFGTAAKVAAALGTEGTVAGAACLDPDTTDGTTVGFYGNAVAEFRPDAQTCRLLSRSVVLADGDTGADALAAGWWTSRWQVPVVLTAGDGSLPPATRFALQSIDIDSIIVLGGTARIPESTVEEAKALATAVAGRVAGTDRYDTSVQMAQRFGGWYATSAGKSFAGDVVCVAASGGSGASTIGWADALAAGPFCARLGAAAGGSPLRALAPVGGDDSATASTGRTAPEHGTVPIVLVPPGVTELPTLAAFAFGSWFPAGAGWCSGDDASDGCLAPGFGVVFGGSATVTSSLEDALDAALGGALGESRSPVLDSGFLTSLDLSALFAGVDGGRQACFERAALHDVRWLSVTEDADRLSFQSETDILRSFLYSNGVSVPLCIRLPSPQAFVTGVGIDGRLSDSLGLDEDAGAVALAATIDQPAVLTIDGNEERVRTSGSPGSPVQLSRDGSTGAVTTATLDIDIEPSSAGPIRATGTILLQSEIGRLSGGVAAEARRTSEGWDLRGSVRFGFTTEGDLVIGGFTATVITSTSDSPLISWRFDGSSQTAH